MGRLRPLAIVLAAVLAAACRSRESAPEASAPAPVPTAPNSPEAPAAPPALALDATKLVGQWLRSDAEYMIEISAVGADGKLQARYLNPREIHVSRAEWKRESGALTFLLEMTDRGYPGSFYTLTYDPGSDSLTGVYHHLGLNQTFDVAFSRVAPDEGTPKAEE